MLASEVIAMLQGTIETVGDLPVCMEFDGNISEVYACQKIDGFEGADQEVERHDYIWIY